MGSHIRDSALLDALERLDQVPFEEPVWRSVVEGRDPLECARGGGRWDDRSFDVLYTSMTREAAVEERRFHLFRGQPIPPSKVHFGLYELKAHLSAVITFQTVNALKEVGMRVEGYGGASYWERKSEYPRSQEIAEACFFLGADGIQMPSARHSTSNIIVFCEQDTRPSVEVIRDHGRMDWT